MLETKSSFANTNETSVDGATPQRRMSPLPHIGEVVDGTLQIAAESHEQIDGLFSSSTPEFSNAMLVHCVNVSGSNDDRSEDKNHAIAIVNEIAPKDGIEAMLATQMASVHIAMMRHSWKLAGAVNIQQLEIQEKTFNKLARTFTAQMEALRKHRHGGQQKVTVEHVTVNEGGQAIVGSVTPGGGQK